MSWACVEERWPAAAISAFDPHWFEEQPITLDAGCTYQTNQANWHGAVLRKDGHLTVIPHQSNCWLDVDPASLTVTSHLVGAATSGVRNWAGGVLMPNGDVLAVPFGAPTCRALLFPPDAGDPSLVGPDLCVDGGDPSYIGGVVDPLTGIAWFSSFDSTRQVVTASVDGGVYSFGTQAFLPTADRLVVDRNGVIQALRQAPSAAYKPLNSNGGRVTLTMDVFGNTLTRDGVHWVTAFTNGAFVSWANESAEASFPTGIGPYVSMGLAADGYVYSLSTNAPATVARFRTDGGIGDVWVGSRFDVAPRQQNYIGVIATPSGLIFIPSFGIRIGRLQIPGGETRSMPALLSPFFNHL